jgi:hypothetical protein
MTRHAQVVDACYDRLLFAKTAAQARAAASNLVLLVLGDSALELPLDEALRECCRELRPASDPVEQARFEAEFVELGIWPSSKLNERAAAA